MRLVQGTSISSWYFDTTFSSLALSVRVTRETAPEAIDKLQRRKLELEVEIHALEREKDAASKERLQVARKAIAQVDEELAPLVAAYENEKSRGDEVNNIRKKIDELKAKADDAERRYEASILHGAIVMNDICFQI
jgi:ATP-dependent Clp protease ATP-binding subunit ClpB